MNTMINFNNQQNKTIRNLLVRQTSIIRWKEGTKPVDALCGSEKRGSGK